MVVDRVVVREGLGTRLADSLETALDLADGLCMAEDADSGDRVTFSAKFACPVSGFTIDEIEPRLFSFNSPFGACPTCDGLGTTMVIDAELVIPDEAKSLYDGAVAPWANSSSQYYGQTLDSLVQHFGVSMHESWRDLPDKVRDTILNGSGAEKITFNYDDGLRAYKTTKPFEGIVPNMERRYRETDSSWVREELGKYQNTMACEACDGQRLKPEALAVKIRKLHISDVGRMSIGEAEDWFGALNDHLSPKDQEIAYRILKEINERLGFPEQRRSELSDPGTGIGHAVRRREPAHPPRLADRLRPDRRAVRARRAVDRPAPARQRPPAGRP